jgi:hypothetical protein
MRPILFHDRKERRMKIQALVAAVALALAGGTAFAQSTPDTAKPTASPDAPAKTTTKKASKKKAKKHAAKKKSSTQSMGAGPAMVSTDLNAPDRQARMDQAYANWKAGGAR